VYCNMQGSNKEITIMKTDSHYYVYAYFDPRNYEMVYVGKGKGSRKYDHPPNKKGSALQRCIHEIKQAGLKPHVRVVAANLTEDQAFLVEKALIWRTGRSLTNRSGGQYADLFRPPNTLHISLPGFDSARGIYYVNVCGDQPHRQWEDCAKYGFLAAGYERGFSSQLDRLEVGSIVAAYQRRHGFVGIGRVKKEAVPVRDFLCRRSGSQKGRHLRTAELKGDRLFHHANNNEKCEYLVTIDWIKQVPQTRAYFKKKSGLFTTTHVVASLSNQQDTLSYLQQVFKVNFEKLLSQS
jgi:hypothetical protein